MFDPLAISSFDVKIGKKCINILFFEVVWGSGIIGSKNPNIITLNWVKNEQRFIYLNCVLTEKQLKNYASHRNNWIVLAHEKYWR